MWNPSILIYESYNCHNTQDLNIESNCGLV
jgi:hypothetical protein